MPFHKTLKQRLQRLQIRDSRTDTFYMQSYPVYLEFFQTRLAVADPLRNDAMIALILVYTWIPWGNTHIGSARGNNFLRARTAWQRILSAEPDEAAIKDINSFVGGISLAATSKWLHFLNPVKYPFWDRNVAWAAYREEDCTDIPRYLKYTEELPKLDLPIEAYNVARKALGKEVSPLRMKEFALFQLGISELAL